MFSDIKKQIRDNFDQLSKNDKLYYAEVDRDEIWEQYLNGFDDPEERQSHNCNCCKSFIRQYGGIVAIENNKLKSIWDITPVDSSYEKAINNLSQYIHKRPITDVFLNGFKNCGTDQNVAENKTTGKTTLWKHFYIELPSKFIVRKDAIPTTLGQLRDNKSVLERSLNELTIDATETILELIDQNSLYRGKEFEGMLKEFLKLQKLYKKLNKEEKKLFVWVQSNNISPALSRIRNTSIGTFLIDLSNNVDLDIAMTAFERVVAPSNYKRPNTIATKKMIQDAKKDLEDSDLLESIYRRFATEQDLNINNVLYVDKSKELTTDPFTELAKESVVNPKTLTKVEEVTIQDFIEKIVPKSKKISLLLENKHQNNFVSLLTATNVDSKKIFKWSNPFSWSYTGGITDAIKERVKEAGGDINGVLRFSIQWNESGQDIVDLDAHATEPNGQHIYYSSNFRKDRGNNRTPFSGQLDVDMINPKSVGVENIVWTDQSKMGEGVYKLYVHNYNGHRHTGFKAQVECGGVVYDFSYNNMFTGYVHVAEVTYSKKEGFSVKSLIDSKNELTTYEKWNLKTNQFHTVKNVLLSPNYWNEQTGNKHFMFVLENCKADENVRPFFNEFLTDDLLKHRKALEMVAGKIKVEDDPNQLSGVGFSETQRNSVIVKVEGNFNRTLRIII